MATYSTIQEAARNDQVDVTTSNGKIADARNELKPRVSIVIRNTSASTADIITVNFGFNTAVANKGMVLQQNESISDSSENGYQCWQGVITAICATANGKLSIFER